MKICIEAFVAASVTLAALLTTPAFAAGDATSPPASALERAIAAFEAGEYTRVLELGGAPSAAEAAGTEGALAADPHEAARLAYLVGETHLLLGNPRLAEGSFRAVLAARPQAVPAQVGLASALLAQDRIEEAGGVLEKTLHAAPDDVGAKTLLARLLARLERFDEAVEALNDARQSAPASPFVTRASVEVLLLAERTTDAAAIAEAFIRENPEHPLGNFLFAVVLERDGEDELAIEQYEEALEKDERFLDAHKNLAILCHTLSDTYQDKQRTEAAYEHYARYFELGGADPSLRAMYDSLLQYKAQILGS